MVNKKRILVYSESDAYDNIVSILNELSYLKYVLKEYDCVSEHEDFQMKMVDFEPSLAIVAKCGAAGMEAVRVAKQINPDVPVFWFSDDNVFVMQSYKLECDYFSKKPVTKEKMLSAFKRCAHMGITL